MSIFGNSGDLSAVAPFLGHAVGAPLGHAHAGPAAASFMITLRLPRLRRPGACFSWRSRPSCRRKDGALTAEPLTSRVFARPEAPVSPISTASGRPVRPASAQASGTPGVESRRPVLDVLRRLIGIRRIRRRQIGRVSLLVLKRHAGKLCLGRRRGREPCLHKLAPRSSSPARAFPPRRRTSCR